MTPPTLDVIEARLKALSDWNEGPLPSRAQILYLLAIARAAEPLLQSLEIAADCSMIRMDTRLPYVRKLREAFEGATSASPRVK